MNAFVCMLYDPRARDMASLHYQFAHLKDVTTDIVARPWSAVHSWTQCVFDSIDSSTYNWPNAQQIQNNSDWPSMARPSTSHRRAREKNMRSCVWTSTASAVHLAVNLSTMLSRASGSSPRAFIAMLPRALVGIMPSTTPVIRG